MIDPDLIYDGNGRATVLKSLRKKRGLTQKELADMCGCSAYTIGALESPGNTLEYAAEALGWRDDPLGLLKPVSLDGKEFAYGR